MNQFLFPGEAYDVDLGFFRPQERAMSLQGVADDYNAVFPATVATQEARSALLYKTAGGHLNALVRFLIDTAHQPLVENMSLWVDFEFKSVPLFGGFNIRWVNFLLRNGQPVVWMEVGDYWANGAGSAKRQWARTKSKKTKKEA